MSKYRVLAVDGGGLRGLLTTILLEKLCRQPDLGPVFDGVDVIAGNSSGALIALAMAHGLGQPTMAETLARTREVFEQGRITFGPRRPSWLGGWWLHSKYGTEARERNVRRLLGDLTLGDLKSHVLIPTFDLDNEGQGDGSVQGVRTWKPKLFHNFAGENSDREVPAWKVALYSSAAPTYFPSVDGYVDGGVYANNPSMCALAQVYDTRYAPDPKPAREDVLLFSVGAGENLKFLEGKTHCWGILPWAPKFVSLTMDGAVGVADYHCRQMLGERNYRRLAPALPTPPEIGLDDFDSIEFMKRFADRPDVADEIDQCARWLRTHWIPEMAAAEIGRLP